jgi:hypothetical protein
VLVKLSDYAKRLDNLRVIHRGRVIFNNDPNKLGRVKCQIKGLLETDNTDVLPWCYPLVFQSGTKPDSMKLQIPELESEVIVFFPYNSIYSPFYISGSISELTKTPGVFDEDYPNTEGWVNSIPSFFRINKIQKTMEYYNDSNGFCIRVDEDGNLFINIPKSLVLNIKEDFFVKCGGNKAVKVAMNSIEDVGLIKETKATSIGEIAAIISNEGMCSHATGVVFGQVASQIAALESKVAELEAKLSEFSNLAQSAKAASEINKSEIAKV